MLPLIVLSALPPEVVDRVAEFWRLDEPESVDRGMLVVEPEDGRARGLAAHQTRVHVEVRGFIAETKVRQSFVNPTDTWLEATYVHPLPETGAVEALSLRTGERLIEAVIEEREAARQRYRRAKRQGRATSLLEQLRSNIFRVKVAQIPPQGTVTVELVIREILHYADGAFSYRFPIPVTPRYDASPSSRPVDRPQAWTAPETSASIQPEIRVSFLPGTAPAWTSASHTMALQGGLFVVVEPSSARDFVMRWAPKVAGEGLALGYREHFRGRTYAAIMVVPPRFARSRPRPRALTFIIDTSGSMDGPSIEQAKRALDAGLQRLRPQDCFDIIRFSSDAQALFGGCRPAGSRPVAEARAWVQNLRAAGGTEMVPALRKALSRAPKGRRLRQIVFMTDGAVSYEAELLSLIRSELGEARLFTVGIGPAPNAAFMRDAARFGRGRFTFIGEVREVEARMDELLRKLESPALTDLAVDWDARVDQVPAHAPDVHIAEPLLLVARMDADPTVVEATAGSGWRQPIPLQPASGIHRLWARRRVEALNDQIILGGDRGKLRAEILQIGLGHGIVTPFTSFIAAERTASRRPGVASSSLIVPTTAPGQLPKGGTAAPSCLAFGLMILGLALVGRWRVFA